MNIYEIEREVYKALPESLIGDDFAKTFKLLLAPVEFGDFSLSISFKLAKVLKKSPTDIANLIIQISSLSILKHSRTTKVTLT